MLQKSKGIQISRKRISSYHEIEKYSHRLKKIAGTLNVMHRLSPKNSFNKNRNNWYE